MMVPSDQVAEVIGKGGASLKQIWETTGCKLQVEQQSEDYVRTKCGAFAPRPDRMARSSTERSRVCRDRAEAALAFAASSCADAEGLELAIAAAATAGVRQGALKEATSRKRELENTASEIPAQRGLPLGDFSDPRTMQVCPAPAEEPPCKRRKCCQEMRLLEEKHQRQLEDQRRQLEDKHQAQLQLLHEAQRVQQTESPRQLQALADIRSRMQIVTFIVKKMMDQADLPDELRQDLTAWLEVALPPDAQLEGRSDDHNAQHFAEASFLFAARAQDLYTALDQVRERPAGAAGRSPPGAAPGRGAAGASSPVARRAIFDQNVHMYDHAELGEVQAPFVSLPTTPNDPFGPFSVDRLTNLVRELIS